MKPKLKIYQITDLQYKEYVASGTIYYSIFKTAFGECLVASIEQKICNILFADSHTELLIDLQSRWKKIKVLKKSLPEHALIKKYFEDTTKDVGIKICLHSTNFKLGVLKALVNIPSGKTSTYLEIAKQIGNEKSVRAVGTAIGQNPIGYIVPCHRVLRNDGKLGGYRWGIERKKKMLQHESL